MNPSTATQPRTLEPLRRWAREQLAVGEEASPEELQAAFLQKLETEEFWPGGELLCAYETLTQPERVEQTTQAMRALGVHHWESKLAEEVEEFATHFFSFTPEERRSRWEELQRDCQHDPQLSRRLQALRVGLALPSEAPNTDVPEISVLLESLKRLFVLRHGASVRLRQVLLETWRCEASHWQQIAKQLEREHPDWARLDPVLVTRLKNGNRLPQSVRPQSRYAEEPSYAGASQEENHWWVVLCIGCALAGGLLAFLLDDKSDRPRQGQKVYPPPQVEPFQSSQEIQRKLRELQSRLRQPPITPLPSTEIPRPEIPQPPAIPPDIQQHLDDFRSRTRPPSPVPPTPRQNFGPTRPTLP